MFEIGYFTFLHRGKKSIMRQGALLLHFFDRIPHASVLQNAPELSITSKERTPHPVSSDDQTGSLGIHQGSFQDGPQFFRR